MRTESLPPVHPWARVALGLGLAALLACLAVSILGIGDDWRAVAISVTVCATLGATWGAGVGAIFLIRRSPVPVRGLWIAVAGLACAMAAAFVFVVGRFAFLFFMWKVMGHD